MKNPYVFPEVQAQVSPAEWQQRVDLAACYRLMAHFRMTDLIHTHVSAKVPGRDDEFLINPYGLMFDEITASSLVRIDGDGKVLQDATGIGVNPAGFVIHSCIHRASHQLACVMHTHTAAGIGVSAQKRGLLKLSQHSMRFFGALAYHDYEGVAFRDEEKPRLQADLGHANFLMLRNHGLLTVGKTIADAFLNMYTFENTCRIQIDAQAGGELIEVNPQIVKGVSEAMRVQTSGLGGAFAWPSLMRKLDRLDQSYKT